ncbi:MAG: DUF655 domain-containing protein [Candidatus ainarchaeum sp.]|nr:DUF655 domain-containing protein [Candidatus ainarchaeum sp.]
MEEYAYVLEYLPSGRSFDSRKEAIVQLLGRQFFTLLEATVHPNASIVLGKKVYVGKEGREDIDRIKRKISYHDLTTSAKDYLFNALKSLIIERENEFVDFINKARPISIRVHTLDLLPGIGKKHMSLIVSEREKSPFTSFQNIKDRIAGVDPVAVFANRILNEIKGEERHNLFIISQQSKY